MGVEGMLGEKKLARAEAAIGHELLFAVATHDGWVVGVTPDDQHVGWCPRTGEVEPITEPVHWTSCPTRGGTTERRTRRS